MPFDLQRFTGKGSTLTRRHFWDDALSAVVALRKIAGRHVTVDEHPGRGTVINVSDPLSGPGAVGACCLDDAVCSVTSEEHCFAIDGAYLGDGTVCSPDDICGHGPGGGGGGGGGGQGGACCGSGSPPSCYVSTEEACGGNWQGLHTNCDPNLCPDECPPDNYTCACPERDGETPSPICCPDYAPICLTCVIDDVPACCCCYYVEPGHFIECLF